MTTSLLSISGIIIIVVGNVYFFLLCVLTRELPVNLHSVLLQIGTQSLTIGECNYFGSHNSDIRNDPGRVWSPHANVWTNLSVHVSVSICTFVYYRRPFFWNYIPMIATHSHNHPLKVSYQLQLCNCQLTLCVHLSKCSRDY